MVANQPGTSCGTFPSPEKLCLRLTLVILAIALVIIVDRLGYSPAEVVVVLSAIVALYEAASFSPRYVR